MGSKEKITQYAGRQIKIRQYILANILKIYYELRAFKDHVCAVAETRDP